MDVLECVAVIIYNMATERDTGSRGGRIASSLIPLERRLFHFSGRQLTRLQYRHQQPIIGTSPGADLLQRMAACCQWVGKMKKYLGCRGLTARRTRHQQPRGSMCNSQISKSPWKEYERYITIGELCTDKIVFDSYVALPSSALCTARHLWHGASQYTQESEAEGERSTTTDPVSWLQISAVILFVLL